MRSRLNAPLIDSVRDPDFLAAIQEAARDQVGQFRALEHHRFRPHFRCHRGAHARRRRRRRAPRSYRDRAHGKEPPRFHRQRFPRAAHSADLHPGIHRDAARQSPGRQSRARVPGNHPQERGPHVAPYRRPAHSGPRRIGRAAVRHAAGRAPKNCCRMLWKAFREVARSYGVELAIENSRSRRPV